MVKRTSCVGDALAFYPLTSRVASWDSLMLTVSLSPPLCPSPPSRTFSSDSANWNLCDGEASSPLHQPSTSLDWERNHGESSLCGSFFLALVREKRTPCDGDALASDLLTSPAVSGDSLTLTSSRSPPCPSPPHQTFSSDSANQNLYGVEASFPHRPSTSSDWERNLGESLICGSSFLPKEAV